MYMYNILTITMNILTYDQKWTGRKVAKTTTVDLPHYEYDHKCSNTRVEMDWKVITINVFMYNC